MAWLPASLLKTHRCLSTCATTMRIRFVYRRRRYATMVKTRYGLATLNSNMVGNIKCWYSFSKLERAESFDTKNWADLVKISVLQQNRIVFITATPCKKRCKVFHQMGWVIKHSYFMHFCSIFKLLPLGTVDDLWSRAIVHQVVHGTSE